MNKQNFDQSLQQQLGDMQKTRMPQRDLWQGIELALANEAAPNDIAAQQQDEPQRNRPRLYAVAAAVAFVGFFSWYGLEQSKPGIDGSDLVAALSQQHEQQKDALLVKFQDQPALTENWQQQLNELDQAANAIRAALKQDPGNVALLKMLQDVHQQQINLIERVHSPKWRQI